MTVTPLLPLFQPQPFLARCPTPRVVFVIVIFVSVAVIFEDAQCPASVSAAAASGHGLSPGWGDKRLKVLF